MADVKWIKISTDLFDNDGILMIESLEETKPLADNIITIWFKLLVFAGKKNNNGVFIRENKTAYTDEMLAAIFKRDVKKVRLALDVLEQYGMIETIDGVITIPNWNKHQTLDTYEKKKERDKIYQAERRAKQRALIEKSSDNRLTTDDSSSSVAVSDKEEEKEIRDKNYIYIVDYLNEKAGTKYKSSSKKTQTCIHARLAEGFTIDDFKTVIDKKCADWMNTEWEKYLRPETLFGTKFESYLNGKGGNNGADKRLDDTITDKVGVWF